MALDMTRNRKKPKKPSSVVSSNPSHSDHTSRITSSDTAPCTNVVMSSDRVAPDLSGIKLKNNALDWLLLILMGVVAIHGVFTFSLFSMRTLSLMVILGLGIMVNASFQRKKIAKQIDYINHTPLPQNIWQNESLKDLSLSASDKSIMSQGLRDFFILRVIHPDKPIAMPSQYVDKLWHAFILDTRRYEEYCTYAFGKILHHIPDYAFSDRRNNIRMYTYQSACRIQGIEPAHPNNQVPRLFAIDHHINYVLGVMTASALAIHMQDASIQLAQGYQLWHANMMAAVDNTEAGFEFDAEIDASGDASCGSSGSDGGDCGGGCGGD